MLQRRACRGPQCHCPHSEISGQAQETLLPYGRSQGPAASPGDRDTAPAWPSLLSRCSVGSHAQGVKALTGVTEPRSRRVNNQLLPAQCLRTRPALPGEA